MMYEIHIYGRLFDDINFDLRNSPCYHYIANYDKHKGIYWEVSVANFDLNMRRNSDREMICKRCESWPFVSTKKWYPTMGLSDTERECVFWID